MYEVIALHGFSSVGGGESAKFNDLLNQHCPSPHGRADGIVNNLKILVIGKTSNKKRNRVKAVPHLPAAKAAPVFGRNGRKSFYIDFHLIPIARKFE